MTRDQDRLIAIGKLRHRALATEFADEATREIVCDLVEFVDLLTAEVVVLRRRIDELTTIEANRQ